MPRRAGSLTIKGRVVTGERVSANFTELGWVRGQFRNKLHMEPKPGTFNIEVLPRYLGKLASLRRSAGTRIVPEDPAFCEGKAFAALVQGEVRAAVLLPEVRDYPDNKLELISPTDIRGALALKDGDVVAVRVFLNAETSPAAT